MMTDRLHTLCVAWEAALMREMPEGETYHYGDLAYALQAWTEQHDEWCWIKNTPLP